MKKKVVLYGVLGSLLIFGAVGCHAGNVAHVAKWEKNSYVDKTIASGFYDVASIKSKGNLVSWTEKYILTPEGSSFVTKEISKHNACKENIEKIGKVNQYELDYEIENGRKFRGAAKRYYNKANVLICTDKDTGKDFKTDWNKIMRGSPIQQAQYDLVTKYKVKFQ